MIPIPLVPWRKCTWKMMPDYGEAGMNKQMETNTKERLRFGLV